MSSTNAENEEASLRAAIADRIRAVCAKDVEGVLAKYAPELVTFDLIIPLQNNAAAVRMRLTAWLASFEGALDYTFSELELAVSGDLAFDHHLTKVHGTNRSGQTIDMWFRETVCYRKLDGAWKITHQHSSIPIDMESGKGRRDLTP